MQNYVINKEDLNKLVERALDDYDVYGPVRKKSIYVYDQISDPASMELNYGQTMTSAKKLFNPPVENMMTFDFEEKKIKDRLEDTIPENPSLIVGLHACDINGLLFLDRVYGGEYDDLYYQKRREKTTIIGLNCLESCENGFCRSVNTHIVLEGYDLFLTPIEDDRYYVNVGSPKGDRLIALAPDLFEEATEDDVDAFRKSLQKKHESLPVEFHLDNLTETLDMAWDDPIWEEIGEDCMNCGSCALVCPTCYCFDVVDEVGLDLKESTRKRKWDTCLYYDFALVAGNHNFREEPEARLKYRFYHKMRGAVHDQGIIACTGCGRCIDACPAGISFLDVLAQLQKNWASAPTIEGGN